MLGSTSRQCRVAGVGHLAPRMLLRCALPRTAPDSEHVNQAVRTQTPALRSIFRCGSAEAWTPRLPACAHPVAPRRANHRAFQMRRAPLRASIEMLFFKLFNGVCERESRDTWGRAGAPTGALDGPRTSRACFAPKGNESSLKSTANPRRSARHRAGGARTSAQAEGGRTPPLQTNRRLKRT